MTLLLFVFFTKKHICNSVNMKWIMISITEVTRSLILVSHAVPKKERKSVLLIQWQKLSEASLLPLSKSFKPASFWYAFFLQQVSCWRPKPSAQALIVSQLTSVIYMVYRFSFEYEDHVIFSKLFVTHKLFCFFFG